MSRWAIWIRSETYDSRLNKRADEVTDVTENSSREIALNDLEADANVNGGSILILKELMMKEQEQKAEQDQKESLADLEVKPEKADATKAGSGTFASGGGAGKVHVHD